MKVILLIFITPKRICPYQNHHLLHTSREKGVGLQYQPPASASLLSMVVTCLACCLLVPASSVSAPNSRICRLCGSRCRSALVFIFLLHAAILRLFSLSPHVCWCLTQRFGASVRRGKRAAPCIRSDVHWRASNSYLPSSYLSCLHRFFINVKTQWILLGIPWIHIAMVCAFLEGS